MKFDGAVIQTPVCSASLGGFPKEVTITSNEASEFALIPPENSEFASIKLKISVNTGSAAPVIRSECTYSYACPSPEVFGYDYVSIYSGVEAPATPDLCTLKCDCYVPALNRIAGIVTSEALCPTTSARRNELLEILRTKNERKCSDIEELPGIHSAYSKTLLNCKKNFNW